MSKKTILTIIVIVLVLCGCTSACCVTGVLAFNWGMGDSIEAKNTTVYELCKNKDDLETSDFEKYFSDDILEDNTEEELKEILDNVFEGIDCDEMKKQNIFEVAWNKGGLIISNDNGTETVEYTYLADGEPVYFLMEKEDDEYVVVGFGLVD